MKQKSASFHERPQRFEEAEVRLAQELWAALVRENRGRRPRPSWEAMSERTRAEVLALAREILQKHRG